MILGYFSWRYVESHSFAESGKLLISHKKFIITASIAGLTIFALVGVLLNYASFNIHPLGKLYKATDRSIYETIERKNQHVILGRSVKYHSLSTNNGEIRLNVIFQKYTY